MRVKRHSALHTHRLRGNVERVFDEKCASPPLPYACSHDAKIRREVASQNDVKRLSCYYMNLIRRTVSGTEPRCAPAWRYRQTLWR
mmetsp:Transcript_2890/g.10483  ORF Transcript_2890/g.10483 Transcript_2890/m.10483 type:complete len:86 (+) Transcript_2890:1659-1916(+)